MKSIIVIEVFPSLKLRIEINIMIKLCRIHSVGSFDVAVQPGHLRLDIDMSYFAYRLLCSAVLGRRFTLWVFKTRLTVDSEILILS